jgi:hypothetical protein
VSLLFIKCGSLDVSQTYGTSWPVIGIALPLPLVPRSRMMELYFHSHIGLHGVVLDYLNTEITLHLPEVRNPDKIEKCSVVMTRL